jgi:formylglycine-generating enzyme required for sulfatase activity
MAEDETPIHDVTLNTYKMMKTEATVAQYRACINAGLCSDVWGGDCNSYDDSKNDYPQNCATYTQAKAFCAWAGARLCTEAEWEYAARSGGQNRVFPWGNHSATCDYAVTIESASSKDFPDSRRFASLRVVIMTGHVTQFEA